MNFSNIFPVVKLRISYISFLNFYMKPIYSVCVCNYNMAETLEISLRSVLDQLDERYEVIVIEDQMDTIMAEGGPLEASLWRLATTYKSAGVKGRGKGSEEIADPDKGAELATYTFLNTMVLHII